MHTIYADNAATTPMSRTAVEAMLPYLDQYYGNPSSLHSLGQQAAEALRQARETMAQGLGCAAKEIYFTSGGSEADTQALLSAAALGAKQGRKHIVSTAFEHHAVLHTLERLEKQGYTVTLLDVHESGVVLPEEAAAALRDDTCLVTVMYANNEIGTIQPIAEIGRICRERGVLFHTDAVQAAGHLPINVAEQQIDLLSLAAHKFHGPKGVGLLYARKGVRLTTLVEGGAQEQGKRGGTENIAAVVSMAAAFREACENMAANAARMRALRDRLLAELLKIPHSILNGDAVQRLPGNINMCFEGIEGESLLLLLDQRGICASSGSACTSGSLDPSHVLLALGRPHEIAHGSLRLTISPETTEEEIDYIARAVPEVVEQLRAMSPVWRDLKEGRKNYVIQ